MSPGMMMQAMPPVESAAAVHLDPAQLLEIQQDYLKQASDLWNSTIAPGGRSPLAADRRFSSEAWTGNPLSQFAAAAYLLNAQALSRLADAVQGDEKTRARVRFAVEQWLAASAPSNFLALNPEAQKKALDTQGQSLSKGLENLIHDMGQGHVSMTDESVF